MNLLLDFINANYSTKSGGGSQFDSTSRFR